MLKGSHHTEKSKEKISLGGTGRIITKETRKKMSMSKTGEKHPNYGKHLSEETRRKISEVHKGKHLSEVTKKKISDAQMGEKGHFYGKQHTEESIKKMSERQLGEKNSFYGKHHSEKVKQKISLAGMGKKQTEGTKRKMSESCLGKNNSFYGKHHTEETRKKISLSHVDWDFYNEHGCTREQYPYGPEWTPKLKKQIATRDNFTCQMCNEILPEQWGTHHIDYDKDNNSEYNLIFLCGHCHSKTNGNRAFWTQYFKDLQIARGFGECQDNSDQLVIDNWIST